MFDKVGHDAYWILMAINLLGLAMVVLFWPETKGISLEHMDAIFGQVDMVEAYKGEHYIVTGENGNKEGPKGQFDVGHHENVV
jgi:hypothetical protein